MNEINISWEEGEKLYWTLNGTLMGKHYNFKELYKSIDAVMNDKRLNKYLKVYDDVNE